MTLVIGKKDPPRRQRTRERVFLTFFVVIADTCKESLPYRSSQAIWNCLGSRETNSMISELGGNDIFRAKSCAEIAEKICVR